MSFFERWLEIVRKKHTLLCVGVDPAEAGQRGRQSIQGKKAEWCRHVIDQVAPYTAAIKINRNYIKDLSRQEVKSLTHQIHELGMLAIDDSKLVDIGSTNAAGFYHAAEEGFDAVTYAPFPGNIQDAISQAHDVGLGIIVLMLMSNPEYQVMKQAQIEGTTLPQYLAKIICESRADGVVIGAPSGANHIQVDEVIALKKQMGDRLVLMPGMGAQGGDTRLIELFGNRTIVNVGRSIIYAESPADTARTYASRIHTAWLTHQDGEKKSSPSEL